MSNRSTVVNLTDLNPSIQFQKLGGFLNESFEAFYQAKATLGKNEFDNHEYLQFLKSEEWIYGETPEFFVKTEAFDLIIKKAILEKAEFHQIPENIFQFLKQELVGQSVKGEYLEKVMERAYKVLPHPYLFQLEENLKQYYY